MHLKGEKLMRKNYVLPKIKLTEMSVDLLPEKSDIYEKIKIKDLIGFSHLLKPKFKYK